MSAPRFFVDERCGCIAVRDRTMTDPDYHGLHNDTEGVVWFRMGTNPIGGEPCPTCKRATPKYWSVSQSDIDEAHNECTRLNLEDAT